MWLVKHIRYLMYVLFEEALMKSFSVYYNLENKCTELMSANMGYIMLER